MNVGIFVFETAYSLDTAVLARHAEELGFESFWVPEHPVIPVTTTSPYRWTQTREAILAMKELWTSDAAEYHGQYYDFPPMLSFPKPVQKPHPPILLGGTARNVFQRVVEWGDGWMPNRVTAEEIRRGRHALNELAGQAGRDPQSIEVLAFGFSGQFRSRVAIQELAEAGPKRGTIWLE